MIRRFSMAALAFLLVLPIAAHAQDDFMMRVDRSTNAADPDDVPDVTITPADGGFQVNTGPAAIIWEADNMASGEYTLSARFTLLEPSGHPNYYGLFYGGGALEGERQNYMYFLIAQNGTYIVKHRAGNETVHDVQGRTASDAIVTPGDDGTAVNDLEVRVGADETEFVINGQVVFTAPKTGMAGRTDGLYGVRINHVIPGVLVQGLEVAH
ncbi:MAG: hypothetical protein OEN56_12160 [Gemmatimonadota bacterium]|nr:hypothetical protein [Gemmatimonadota bacterium]MDH3423213.1 hypothetical protein [Gemmatimonadota bacterium]